MGRSARLLQLLVGQQPNTSQKCNLQSNWNMLFTYSQKWPWDHGPWHYLGFGDLPVIFTDNFENEKGQKLRTYILIENSLIDYNVRFWKNGKVFIFIIFRAIGNVEGFLNLLFLTLESPNYSNWIKKHNENDIWTFHFWGNPNLESQNTWEKRVPTWP